MNNDAKDVIGRLRAINILLLLLHIEKPNFPLDSIVRSLLDHHRDSFIRMIEIVSQLAHFGNMKSELLSSVDDILDPASNTHYTRDYVDMILSLFSGNDTILHLDYGDTPSVGKFLTRACQLNVSNLLESIIWLRVGFLSCYPNQPLTPLDKAWSEFCGLVCGIGGDAFGVDHDALVLSSLRAWRFSETVTAALGKANTADMPHRTAFLKSINEVDALIANHPSD